MGAMHDILERVRSGELSVDAAAGLLEPELDLGFARLDRDRPRRRGFAEVVYGPGKTVEHLVAIVEAMVAAGQDVLVTRVSLEQADAVRAAVPATTYHKTARALTVDVGPRPEPTGCVTVVSAGTSDLPVAEEAALAAERLGARVERIADVGVAGLHRLMRHLDRLRASRCVVVVAGMEGALPSVVGGLLDRPVVAVPTSVGYGTGQAGQVALLAMLNSCVPGITVVNIDNGFGAGAAAALINRVAD